MAQVRASVIKQNDYAISSLMKQSFSHEIVSMFHYLKAKSYGPGLSLALDACNIDNQPAKLNKIQIAMLRC